MLRPALTALALTLGSLPVQAAEVTVFAAASLKNALDPIAAAFSRATGDQVAISYAGSSQLARQIIQGAPADLFISANVEWMDEIEGAGLLAKGSRRDLLGNRLVLIGHGEDADPVRIGPDTDLAALLGGGKLAMALVDSVPAGQYGKAALQNLGIWADVRADVAQADNVRAALALVATGEAPYGVVYATDAAAEDNVSVAGRFPEDSYPPIIYPAALLKEGDDDAARAFLAALSGKAAGSIFEAQGFTVLK